MGKPFKELITLSGKCFFGITWMIRNTGKVYPFREGMTHSEDLLFYISNSAMGIYSSTEKLIYRCRHRKNSAMANLKKLEDGYFELYEILTSQYRVSTHFKRKIKSIMIKSYLSKFKILNVVMVIFR